MNGVVIKHHAKLKLYVHVTEAIIIRISNTKPIPRKQRAWPNIKHALFYDKISYTNIHVYIISTRLFDNTITNYGPEFEYVSEESQTISRSKLAHW